VHGTVLKVPPAIGNHSDQLLDGVDQAHVYDRYETALRTCSRRYKHGKTDMRRFRTYRCGRATGTFFKSILGLSWRFINTLICQHLCDVPQDIFPSLNLCRASAPPPTPPGLCFFRHVRRSLVPAPENDVSRSLAKGFRLNPPEHHKNDDDDKNEAQSATWEISPTAAVRPCRQSADQKQYQYDDQDGSEVHGYLHVNRQRFRIDRQLR
jgi:hypothetical protein